MASRNLLEAMRNELTDFECATIRSLLPNKSRGIPRVDDRRVLNGIFWSCAQVLSSSGFIPAQEGEKWYLNTRISGPFRQTTNQAMPTLKAIQADAITAPSSFI
jgi:hypothetical protein